MPSSVICCDASLIVRLITAADDSDVFKRWANWKDSKATFVAPPLLKYELVNAFHRMRMSGEITSDGCAHHLSSSLGLPIVYDYNERIHHDALDLAARFGLSAAYDAHYLAVSRFHDAEFWTYDRRLYRTVASEFKWVFLGG